MSHMGDLVRIFASVLDEPQDQLTDATRGQIKDFLRSLSTHHGDSFSQLLSGLDAEKLAVLQLALQN